MPIQLQCHCRTLCREIGVVLLAALVGLLISGCQGQDPKGSVEGPTPAASAGPSAPDQPAASATGQAPPAQRAPAPPAVPGATIGGDGSSIELATLSSADLDALTLGGELACAFSVDGDTLLLAKGDVASNEPARGVVKPGGHVEAVTAPGGFDAMLRGARFQGAGKTIDIEPTGPASAGGESPPSPATLTYHRADGATRVLAGQWQCGP